MTFGRADALWYTVFRYSEARVKSGEARHAHVGNNDCVKVKGKNRKARIQLVRIILL
jgi:hypothetical protein